MDSGRSLFGYNQCDGLGCFGVEWDIRFQSTAYRHGDSSRRTQSWYPSSETVVTMTDDSRAVDGRFETAHSRHRILQAVGTATVATAGIAGCLGQRGTDEIPLVNTGLEQTVPDGVAQFRHSLERWGYYPDATVPDEVEREWRLDRLNTGSHGAAKASAVPLPDGGLVFPGDTGYLVALDADGTERWRTGTDTDSRGIHGTPAIADGRAYVGAYDGVLYAIDLETGDIDWRQDLGDAIGSSPLYHDGTIVMAVEYYDPEGSTFAVDAADGSIVWEDPRDGRRITRTRRQRSIPTLAIWSVDRTTAICTDGVTPTSPTSSSPGRSKPRTETTTTARSRDRSRPTTVGPTSARGITTSTG